MREQLVLVCFDVRDDRRLRQVAKTLKGNGVRVQYSIFECHLNPQQLARLKSRIAKIVHPTDSVRYYPLCGKDRDKVVVDGRGSVTVSLDYHIV